MLNSDVTKKQRVVVVVVVVGENVLKWSIGLKSKLQQKPTLMLRMLRETSKKSVQKIKKRTPRLKLMQLSIRSLRHRTRESTTKLKLMQLMSSRLTERMIKEGNK